MKPRTGDRSWLNGGAKTWRWNEGTYAERGSYDAVEANRDGLTWYHWDHGYAEGGIQARRLQTVAEFREAGPLLPMPEALLEQLRSWLAQRAGT